MSANFEEYKNATITSFNDAYTQLIANRASKLMQYTQQFSFEGQSNEDPFIGSVNMYQDNGRFVDVKLTDTIKQAIIAGKDNYFVRIPVDIDDKSNTGKDELAPAVREALASIHKTIDRAIIKAALGPIQQRKGGVVSTRTFEELGGDMVNALGGLTYEHILELDSKLFGSGGQDEQMSPLLVMTNLERAKLLRENKLTSTDFYRMPGSETGAVAKVLDFDAVVYPDWSKRPSEQVIQSTATYRRCFAMNPGAVMLFLPKMADLQIIKEPKAHNVYYVSLQLKLSTYRRFHERVIELRTPLEG